MRRTFLIRPALAALASTLLDPSPDFSLARVTTLRLDPYFGRSVSARGTGEWAGQSGGFGPLYTSGGARTVQVSLKLTF